MVLVEQHQLKTIRLKHQQMLQQILQLILIPQQILQQILILQQIPMEMETQRLLLLTPQTKLNLENLSHVRPSLIKCALIISVQTTVA